MCPEVIKLQKDEIPFIKLTFDYMFKRVFTLNPELLKDFLVSVLRLELNPKESELIIENSELTKSVRREYRKTVDILVLLNGTKTIDIELNSSTFNEIKYRNALYIEKIMTTGIESGTSNRSMSDYYYYQLNLNVHEFKKDDVGEKCFCFQEKSTGEILIDNLQIIYKSLAYYSKLYYNKKGKVTRDVIWLALINAKDYNELKEMSELIMNKKDKDKFLKDVRDASRDKFIISEWETEKMAELVKEEGIKYAKLDGYEEAILKNVKAMLENNADYEFISKVSGKSIEEIKKIEKSMKD